VQFRTHVGGNGQKTPSFDDWHPEDVKAAIRKTGTSLTLLANRSRKSISAIRMALFRPSAPVQSLIAAHLGLHPREIWPSRYDDQGNALDRRRSVARSHSRRATAANSQKQEAA
jgi:Ner family transcriptional regulator